MSGVYFTADTHFGHAKILQFEPEQRPFKTIEEHDNELIKRWNKVVHSRDVIYHLGDLYLGYDQVRFDEIMNQLNGTKILIRGNHDTLPLEYYTKHFKDVCGVVSKYGFVMSHVPLHPESVKRWGRNVHGHTHHHRVSCERQMQFLDNDGIERQTTEFAARDPRYFCVSVEQHNLTPINLDNMRKEFNDDLTGIY